MPASSGHTHQLLRFHRPSSCLLKAPSASPCCDTDVSHSPYLSASTASSSRPPSARGISRQAVHVAPSASHLPASSSLTTDRLGVDRAPEESSHQPSQVSRPLTPVNIVDLNPSPKFSPQVSAARPPVHLTYLSDSTNLNQSQHPLCLSATPSQQSLPSTKDLPPSQQQSQGIFKNAHNFSVVGSNFIDNNKGNITLTTNFNNSDNFMRDLLKETILGAAADSSARDPPPRCYPGTRLAILERCLHFIAHCNGVKKMRWIVGAAGVGKSAIMQNVAESPQPEVACRASVFLSINGRNDGAKTIITLSYQFAAKSQLYRQVIEDEIQRDPSLYQSSMVVQFEKFIVQPFIHNKDLNSAGRVLIIVDGLDECRGTRPQVELLHLISGFCISYPSSPIVWFIASRPETHIISFFSKPEVMSMYEKEEIAVESDQARADVERFLRHELMEIGRASDLRDPHWPDEQSLWKLANAAGGLFAYAQTVIRYIGDSSIGDPALQLSEVLNVIDELPMSELSREEHPMALIDALYARIISNIPPKIMVYARKILLALASDWDSALEHKQNFHVMCNWFGMTADEAFAALNRLRSVLNFSPRHTAGAELPRAFHKSFIDHIHRSRSFSVELEVRQINVQCAFRVLKDAPSGISFDMFDYSLLYGTLVRCSGAGDTISLSWPAPRDATFDNTATRLSMYKLAIGEVAAGIKRRDPMFQSKSYIKLLTTRFGRFSGQFPLYELCDLVFDKSRRHEFMRHDVLRQIPVKAINISEIYQDCIVKTQLHRPVLTTALPDAWNSSCKHRRAGQYGQRKKQNWAITFGDRDCLCFDRLTRQMKSWIAQFPNHAVPILWTSAHCCCIEVEFVDPEDSVSKWTYWLKLELARGAPKALSSIV